MSEPILHVAGLEVRFGAVHAVRGIDLELHHGEVVGLIGPNGAGKSTALHAIMGLATPAGGDVRLRGRSITGRDTEHIARQGIALVPEGRRIFGEFTVEENLRLGTFSRRSRDGLDEDMSAVFDLFPVCAEFRSRPAGHLSGGQQQQLAIARALVSRPDVLLLDEPSLGLAPALVEDLFAALQRVSDSGVPTLLVEQRAERTVAFADRTHVMRDGRIVLTLTPDDAHDTDRLSHAYFGA